MSRCARLIISSALVAAGLAAAAPAAAQTFSRTNHTGLFHPLVADLNGDGRMDLAGTTFPGTNAGVLLNTGSGAFGPLVDLSGRRATRMTIAGGDLNGDGRVDLVVTINQADIGLALLFGNGNGTFQRAGHLPNTAEADSPSVVVTDLDNDGAPGHRRRARLRPATSRRAAIATMMSVLMGNGDGTFQPTRDFEVGSGMNKIAVGDFNRDGVKDLVIGGQRRAPVPARRASATGRSPSCRRSTLAPTPNFVEVVGRRCRRLQPRRNPGPGRRAVDRLEPHRGPDRQRRRQLPGRR